MKGIINGKLYDTSKAKHIVDNIYVTKKGNYFRAIELSHLGLRNITPISRQEAKNEIGLTHPDIYIMQFGRPKEA